MGSVSYRQEVQINKSRDKFTDRECQVHHSPPCHHQSWQKPLCHHFWNKDIDILTQWHFKMCFWVHTVFRWDMKYHMLVSMEMCWSKKHSLKATRAYLEFRLAWKFSTYPLTSLASSPGLKCTDDMSAGSWWQRHHQYGSACQCIYDHFKMH